jgi:lactoylglutathione lyase
MFLCFATEELEVVHERAVSLGMNPSDIRWPEPDAKYFYVYDPDGVSVQFREYK